MSSFINIQLRISLESRSSSHITPAVQSKSIGTFPPYMAKSTILMNLGAAQEIQYTIYVLLKQYYHQCVEEGQRSWL